MWNIYTDSFEFSFLLFYTYAKICQNIEGCFNDTLYCNSVLGLCNQTCITYAFSSIHKT